MKIIPSAVINAVSDLPAGARVVVAMSGGVDSSVCAAIMHHLGFEVIGITLQLYDHGAAINKRGACCAGADIMDARKAAHKIGIKHFVLNYESRFKESVIDDFVASYMRGETPLPCVRCNQSVKFADLLSFAKQHDAVALITGHYVQRINNNGLASLHSAIYTPKDQSYFLFATTPEQLHYLRFPLGGITKETTRQLAKEFGLAIADKPDSMDICFVPGGDYTKVVQKHQPTAQRPGNIIDKNGKILGQHNGTIGFTIGQRKGIGIGGAVEPYFVIEIRPTSNEIVVGTRADCAIEAIQLKECNWLAPLVADEWHDVAVKFRSTMECVPARLKIDPEKAIVVFNESQFALARGQACVVYNQTQIIGGGWIY